MAEQNYYPKKQHDINVPDVFYQQDLDPALVSGLADRIIGETQNAELARQTQEQNDLYHMKRLAEQAEGMSEEEALTMCRHFDTSVLIKALKMKTESTEAFMSNVISASKKLLAEMEN